MADFAPRVSPGTWREIGVANALIVRALSLGTQGRRANIFTTLARHRSLFRRWLWFAGGLMPGGKLSRRETELVILRVAHNTGSEYEWEHHERLGRRAGLNEFEIAGALEPDPGSRYPQRTALMLRTADELHEKSVISDSLWAELSTELDAVRLIELCMLIGHYEMIAMTLKSLRVQVDCPACEIPG